MKAAIHERYLYIDIEDEEREHFDPDSFLFGLVKIKTWSDLFDFISVHKGFFFNSSFERGDVLKSSLEYYFSDLPVSNLRGNLLGTLGKYENFDYLDKMFLDDAGISIDTIEVYDLERLMEYKRLFTHLMQYIAIANGSEDVHNCIEFESFSIDGKIVDLMFSKIPDSVLSEVPNTGKSIADHQYFYANEELKKMINKTSLFAPDVSEQVQIIKNIYCPETWNKEEESLKLADLLWKEIRARYEQEMPYIKFTENFTMINSQGRLENDVFVHVRDRKEEGTNLRETKRQIAGELAELVFQSLDRELSQEIVYVNGGFSRQDSGYYTNYLFSKIEQAAIDDKLALCAQCGLPVKKRKGSAYCSASCRTLANKERRETAIKYAASGKPMDEAISAIGIEYASSIKRWYEEVLDTNPAH